MEITEHHYRIADLDVAVCAPRELPLERMLPSFAPFRTQAAQGPGRAALVCRVYTFIPPEYDGRQWEHYDEADNDLGNVQVWHCPEAYKFRVDMAGDGLYHELYAQPDFTCINAYLRLSDPRAGDALCSMLRIAFAQMVLARDGVSVHASVVALQGRAYLFMGASGTGKSTHSRLWMQHFEGALLLNDDNPVVRIFEDRTVAYGTPWSGKTPCYRNLQFEVGGMVRLEQAPENRYYELDAYGAFCALLPGISVVHRDTKLQALMFDRIAALAERVRVGRLACRPDAEAARLCAQRLRE